MQADKFLFSTWEFQSGLGIMSLISIPKRFDASHLKERGVAYKHQHTLAFVAENTSLTMFCVFGRPHSSQFLLPPPPLPLSF